jgi:hypothetical protein
MTAMPDNDPDPGTAARSVADAVPLKDVLINLSREMETVARKAGAIDEAVGDMIVDGSEAMEAIPVALLQDVDLLRQTADCLHILIDNLAHAQSCDCTVPRAAAGRGVYLDRLQRDCLGEVSQD